MSLFNTAHATTVARIAARGAIIVADRFSLDWTAAAFALFGAEYTQRPALLFTPSTAIVPSNNTAQDAYIAVANAQAARIARVITAYDTPTDAVAADVTALQALGTALVRGVVPSIAWDIEDGTSGVVAGDHELILLSAIPNA